MAKLTTFKSSPQTEKNDSYPNHLNTTKKKGQVRKERSGSEKKGQVRKVSFTGVATLDLIQPYNLGYLSIQGTLNYFAIRFRSVL